MDLMIDCMPLYEMIEDDMKNIINCSISNSSSPSCLSDEEQLALTSSSMFEDLFFLSNNCTSGQPNIDFDVSNINIQNNQDQSSVVSNNSQNQYQQQQQQQIFANINTDDSLTNTNQQQHQKNSNNTSDIIFDYNLSTDMTKTSVPNPNFSPNDSFTSSTNSSSACSPFSNSQSSVSSPLSLSLSSSSLCAALASTKFSTNLQGTSTSPSTAPNSTCSSSLSSPSTTPLSHQYSNYSSPSSNIQANTDVSITTNTSKYMHDSYLNNNFNLYHVINPMDLNRNYNNNNNNNNQSQYDSTNLYDINSDMNENNNINNNNILNNINNSSVSRINQTKVQLSCSPMNSPTSQGNGRIKSISISKQQLTNGTQYTPQVAKRGKFSHNSSNSINLVDLIKLEPKFNSDGESSLSNESDSNSSVGSIVNSSNNDCNVSSKRLVIATKIDPLQLKNSNTNKLTEETNYNQNSQTILNVNTPPQINLIKINGPKDNLASTFFSNSLSSGTNQVNNLKLPVTCTKINSINEHSNLNHKTIIQYKQLLTNKQHQNNLNVTNTIINLNNNNLTQVTPTATNNNNNETNMNSKVYPKPPYSYSCLIAMALRNSDSGNLPVSDIYEFIIENFPYYKTARDGWKNSIRHNLSLNKCFEKIENPTNGSKKGCLWALNPDKCKKLEEECKRCRQRDPVNIRLSMSRPDDLNKIERGEQRLKKFSLQNNTNQRKTVDMAINLSQPSQPASTLTTSYAINNNNANANDSIQPISTTSGQISLSPNPARINNQIMNEDSFLLDWTNKNASAILKEEDQYFDNSDIKFDPILLTNLNPTSRSANSEI